MESQTVFALIVFVITYVLMFSFQNIRPHVSIASAFIFVIAGSLGLFPEFRYTWMDALREIDWNVIMMISGTPATLAGTIFISTEEG